MNVFFILIAENYILYCTLPCPDHNVHATSAQSNYLDFLLEILGC